MREIDRLMIEEVDNAPGSHDELSEEGITLNVPGLINFDHSTTPSMNVFLKTP